MQIAYGPVDQPITLTALASRSSTQGAYSAAIDNTVDRFIDVLVWGAIKTGASYDSFAVNFAAEVYAYGSPDGVLYPNGITGADAQFTAISGLVRKIGVIPVNYTGFGNTVLNTVFPGGPWSVARALGGLLPSYWGLAVLNITGTPMAASGHEFVYQGIWMDGP